MEQGAETVLPLAAGVCPCSAGTPRLGARPAPLPGFHESEALSPSLAGKGGAPWSLSLGWAPRAAHYTVEVGSAEWAPGHSCTPTDPASHERTQPKLHNSTHAICPSHRHTQRSGS